MSVAGPRKMGNDESSELLTPADTPPLTLAARTLPALAAHLRAGHAHNIVILSGAGLSTSAGIPDFRSPETGLYANLARLQLPYAEAVFDMGYFARDPAPFYALARELYPGRWRPTIAHAFVRLLHEKGMLLKHFTQNIDCLDREAGVPAGKIVEAHGSFARQSCINCKAPYPAEAMKEHVAKGEVPRCGGCDGGLVKPEIVFFGEALPAEFFDNMDLLGRADLCIVMGTSLTVQPFAALPGMVPKGVPRVLINLERVGGLGGQPDDVLLLGDCDEGVCQIAHACGWLDELVELWESVGGKLNPKHPALNQRQVDPELETEPAMRVKTKDEAVADEVDKLTKDVERSLKISKDHERKTREALVEEGEEEDKGGREAIETDKMGRGGLSHVFPHIKKDSSL